MYQTRGKHTAEVGYNDAIFSKNLCHIYQTTSQCYGRTITVRYIQLLHGDKVAIMWWKLIPMYVLPLQSAWGWEEGWA